MKQNKQHIEMASIDCILENKQGNLYILSVTFIVNDPQNCTFVFRVLFV